MSRCVVAVMLSISAMIAVQNIFSEDPGRNLIGYVVLILTFIPLVIMAILEHYETEYIMRWCINE